MYESMKTLPNFPQYISNCPVPCKLFCPPVGLGQAKHKHALTIYRNFLSTRHSGKMGIIEKQKTRTAVLIGIGMLLYYMDLKNTSSHIITSGQ